MSSCIRYTVFCIVVWQIITCASVDFNDNNISSLIFPNLMPEGRLNEQKILIFTILYLNVKNSVNDKNPMTVYETQIATVIGIFMLLEQLINKNQ